MACDVVALLLLSFIVALAIRIVQIALGGLEIDPKIAEVGGDGPYLYAGSAMQFEVDEYVAVEICRPERRLFKLALFCKRPEGMTPTAYEARWIGEEAEPLDEVATKYRTGELAQVVQ